MEEEFKINPLEPVYADSELREDSTVIPNENVISDIALVVNDKVADHADNQDENTDNDVYNHNEH